MLVGGKTISHYIHKYHAKGGAPASGTVVIVDEWSEVQLHTWTELARWALVGVKFILLGDADGQRKPIFDKWAKAMEIKDIRESRLIWELCGGLRVKLTTYRRGTDPELFDFYTGLYDIADEMAGSITYNRTILQGALRYPTSQDCDCYFVVRHIHRILINRYMNHKFAAEQPRVRFIPAPTGEAMKVNMKPQAMIIWPGMELLCYNRRFSKNCPITGAVYVVQDWDHKSVVIKLHPDYVFEQIEDLAPPLDESESESDNEDDEQVSEVPAEDCSTADGIYYKLSLSKAAQILRPQFALCYASIQGRTFRNKHVGLLNVWSRALGMRDIITAASRPTHGDCLHFITVRHEQDLLLRADSINDTDLAEAAGR